MTLYRFLEKDIKTLPCYRLFIFSKLMFYSQPKNANYLRWEQNIAEWWMLHPLSYPVKDGILIILTNTLIRRQSYQMLDWTWIIAETRIEILWALGVIPQAKTKDGNIVMSNSAVSWWFCLVTLCFLSFQDWLLNKSIINGCLVQGLTKPKIDKEQKSRLATMPLESCMYL